MKVLVTGASGFIGSKLVPRLLSGGHVVRTFGRSHMPLSLAVYPIEHVRGDITDGAAVLSAIHGCDVVYHLAGLVSYRRADRDIQHRVNVTGTRNVMEACLKAGVSRVIHTSSIAGWGIPAPGTVGTEETPYNLENLGLNYCDSKYEGEQVALEYGGKGLPVIVLAPGIIFGEGDTHPHHRAIFLAMSKGWLVGWPPGGVTFCDIEDVVQAHINAMTMGSPGQRYALGSANLTYREAALVLSRVLGCRPPRFQLPGPLLVAVGAACEFAFMLAGKKAPLTRQAAWLSCHKIFFSSGKAQKELAMPVTPFEETIRRTAPYYLGLIAAQSLSGKALAERTTSAGTPPSG